MSPQRANLSHRTFCNSRNCSVSPPSDWPKGNLVRSIPLKNESTPVAIILPSRAFTLSRSLYILDNYFEFCFQSILRMAEVSEDQSKGPFCYSYTTPPVRVSTRKFTWQENCVNRLTDNRQRASAILGDMALSLLILNYCQQGWKPSFDKSQLKNVLCDPRI